MDIKYDAIIVGAGMAGLTAARYLEEYNLKVLVLESEARPGGRIKTDEKDGFRMDRGFQVFLSAYPTAKKYLDYDALQLRYFNSGALCFKLKEQFTVSDTSNNKLALPRMAFSPVGKFMDKIRMTNLVNRLKAKSVEEIFDGPNISTSEYLKDLGFSDKIVERFFRPFFTGIFLEPDLSTSARMFEFVFKMFAEEGAALPAKGMEEIPRQLEAQLRKTEFRFQTRVSRVEPGRVHLENGEVVEGSQIIVATQAEELLPQLEGTVQQWRSTSQFYFATEEAPFAKPLIGLHYRPDGLVNNIAVLNKVAPEYAPKGENLIQVSLHYHPSESVEAISQRIKDELAITFGASVQHWRYLRSYQVKKALPYGTPPVDQQPFEQSRVQDGIYLAGDHLLNPSINAAMTSGEMAAKALVINHVND